MTVTTPPSSVRRGAARFLPSLAWAPAYDPADRRGDLAAGLTVGAMLVPQAMAYALLAGLPPEIGLYAATVPVVPTFFRQFMVKFQLNLTKNKDFPHIP